MGCSSSPEPEPRADVARARASTYGASRRGPLPHRARSLKVGHALAGIGATRSPPDLHPAARGAAPGAALPGNMSRLISIALLAAGLLACGPQSGGGAGAGPDGRGDDTGEGGDHGVPEGCVPATCGADACGAAPDGCGGTLACGPCPGSLRWAASIDAPHQSVLGFATVLDVDVDAAGNRYLLTTTLRVWRETPESTLELRRFDADGNGSVIRSWAYPRARAGSRAPRGTGGTASDEATAFRLAVTPSGDVLIGVLLSCEGPTCGKRIDFGAGPVDEHALVRLDPAGRLRWQRTLSGHPFSLATDRAGAAIVNESSFLGSRVTRFDPAGDAVWSRALSPDHCTADEEGNVCAWHTWPGHGVLHVVKHAAADGAVVWSREIAGPSWVTSIDARAEWIAVVASAPAAGPLRFGTSEVSGNDAVLLLFDAAGTPRWAAGVEQARARLGPSGRVFVGTRSDV